MNRKILKLAIPSILANITIPLVGITDIAIAGRLGNTASLGAIAIGTMLFDLLYWNFGFLRVGTGGRTAQAYGRRNLAETVKCLTQGVTTAIIAAALLILIQWPFVELSFLCIDCSPEVERMARDYFFIRIWAAPATLSLFAFKGWFIGMQNTVSPMVVDIVINAVNIGASIWLGLFTPLGFAGIALGTVIAQYVGLILAVIFTAVHYGKLFKHFNLRRDTRLREMMPFYRMSANLFIRSLCFLFIYCGYTIVAARYGDTELAVSAIIMKIMMLFSYFSDGFAFAGEALTGKYIGGQEPVLLRRAVRLLFLWIGIIGIASSLLFVFDGGFVISLIAKEEDVILASRQYNLWLILMPLVGGIAFLWDGIFVGATASIPIRNSMLLAVGVFYITFLALKNDYGMQALYLAYILHLIARGLYLSVIAKREVFNRVSDAKSRLEQLPS